MQLRSKSNFTVCFYFGMRNKWNGVTVWRVKRRSFVGGSLVCWKRFNPARHTVACLIINLI